MNSKEKFVSLLCQSKMIRFGSFTTKAGRSSPYFINSGLINRADHMRLCGELYAKVLFEKFGESCLHLYGPAYKGIPLVTLTASSLAHFGHETFTATFNRKEAKDHGEKGIFVGYELKAGDEVIIIEDVVSRGSSFQETRDLLNQKGVGIAGLLVGVDRQEQGFTKLQASIEISQKWNIPVHPIVTMEELTTILEENQKMRESFAINTEVLSDIRAYRQRWGGSIL